MDPDARLGWKSEDQSFFGYKSHLAMTEERIITAVEVTSGEKADGNYLQTLVKKTKESGIEVREVLADSAYSVKDNLDFVYQDEILPHGKKGISTNRQITYHFDVTKCQTCPLREGCYKPGAKSKTYSVRIVSATHQKAIDYQKTEEFITRKKLRGQIESKNAEMKPAHGMANAKYTGLFGMQIQVYLTSIVVNVKRMIRLIEGETAIV